MVRFRFQEDEKTVTDFFGHFVGTFLFPFLEILELKKSRDQLIPQRRAPNGPFWLTVSSQRKVPFRANLEVDKTWNAGLYSWKKTRKGDRNATSQGLCILFFLKKKASAFFELRFLFVEPGRRKLRAQRKGHELGRGGAEGVGVFHLLFKLGHFFLGPNGVAVEGFREIRPHDPWVGLAYTSKEVRGHFHHLFRNGTVKQPLNPWRGEYKHRFHLKNKVLEI